MHVLKVQNVELFIGVEDGFYVKVDTKNQALQVARIGDAQKLQQVTEGFATTEVVTV